MTSSARRASFPRMIDQFLLQRVAAMLPPRELDQLRDYLLGLIADGTPPPRNGGKPDWLAIAQECGVAPDVLETAASVLEPGIDAITRFIGSRKPRRKEAGGAGNPAKKRQNSSTNRVGAADKREPIARRRNKTAPPPEAATLPPQRDAIEYLAALLLNHRTLEGEALDRILAGLTERIRE